MGFLQIIKIRCLKIILNRACKGNILETQIPSHNNDITILQESGLVAGVSHCADSECAATR